MDWERGLLARSGLGGRASPAMALCRFLLPPVTLALLTGALASCAAFSTSRSPADPSSDVRAAVAEETARATLTFEDVRSLAEIVLHEEIRSATGEAALKRIEAARPCASTAESALRARAKVHDPAGAAALIALHEADLSGRGELSRHLEAPDAAFRAAGARSLTRAQDGALRRKWMADPDERIRKQALRAALHAVDPEDRAPLLEAARLDPSPALREMATRAAGAIGGEEVVRGLADLWSQADEAGRRAIVEAWGMPNAAKAGGVARLLRVLETESGSPAILAAATLVRSGGVDRGAGIAALSRAMREGSPRNRVLAIRLAPVESSEILLRLREVAEDPDTTVRVAALSKLTASPQDRATSLDALASLGEEGLGLADEALARSGDPRAIPRLVPHLSAEDPAVRARAAGGLIDAGEFRRAAELLGDADPSVRTEVACRLLTNPPNR